MSNRTSTRPPREFVAKKRKPNEFVLNLKPEDIDYKRLDVLVRFLRGNGKIVPARRSGLSRKLQTRASQAIKQARYLALLPYRRDTGDPPHSRRNFSRASRP